MEELPDELKLTHKMVDKYLKVRSKHLTSRFTTAFSRSLEMFVGLTALWWMTW